VRCHYLPGQRRPGKSQHLPLHRLPDFQRLGVSRGGARACGNLQAAERGQPKIYVKTAESGDKRAQAFCANCGSAIYSSAVSNTPSYFLRVGALEQRASLPPRRQIWCKSALPWSASLEGIPQLARQ